MNSRFSFIIFYFVLSGIFMCGFSSETSQWMTVMKTVKSFWWILGPVNTFSVEISFRAFFIYGVESVFLFALVFFWCRDVKFLFIFAFGLVWIFFGLLPFALMLA